MNYVHLLLRDLRDRGLHELPMVNVSLAPVHALSDNCRAVDQYCLAPADYATIEPQLYMEAAKLGFPYACYPSVPWGTCGAVHIHTYVVDPDGHLQKCWNTVGHTDKRVAHISDPALREPLLASQNPLLHRWLTWDPLQTKCSECSDFPLCQGGCPFKQLYPNEVQAASRLQCSRWKYNLEAALGGFLASRRAGLKTLVLQSRSQSAVS